MTNELEELESIAREATKETLKDYIIPNEYRNDLVVTTLFEGDLRIFKLYVPGEKREDAKVIALTTVNSKTRNVSVEIINLKEK